MSQPAVDVDFHAGDVGRREGQFAYSQAVAETIRAYARALTKIAGGMKAIAAVDSSGAAHPAAYLRRGRRSSAHRKRPKRKRGS